MGDGVISKTVAAKLLGVGVEHNVVRACRHKESIVGERAVGTEVEHEDEVASHECKHLVAVVVPYLLYGSLREVLLAFNHLEHGLVEVAKIVVVEFLVVHEVPLAACILVAPSVALAREVNPFGMSELVTHEVEIAAINCSCSHEAYHLVQGNAAVNHKVLVALLEVPVHVGVD